MLEWMSGEMTEPELWEKWLHSDAVRAFESGQVDPGAFAERTIAEFGLTVPPTIFLAAFETWIDGLFDGVEELLDDLRPTYRLATMSNTNAIHWPKLTGQMGLGTLIETHYPSHQTGLLKPDREAFENVIEKLALPAERILFFDDNELNVAAARAAGLQSERTRGIREISSHLRKRRLVHGL